MTTRNWNYTKKKQYDFVNYTSSTFYTGSRVYLQRNFVKSHSSGSVSSNSSPRNSRGKLMLQANPYSKNTLDFEASAGHYFRKVDNYGWIKSKVDSFPYYSYSSFSTWNDISNKFRLPNPNFTTAEDSVNSSFYKEVGAQKLNVLVAFKERQQTVDMVKKAVLRIVQSIRLLRKGRLKDAARALGVADGDFRKFNAKDLAGLWLELQYGWKPLLSDIDGAMKIAIPRPVRLPVKISRQNKERFSILSQEVETNGLVKNRVTLKCFATVSGEYLVSANELGLINIPTVIWETIPFSFVVDWFLPIGDWLNAQTALLGITLSDVNTTRTSYTTFDCRDMTSYNGGHTWTTYSYSRGSCSGRRLIMSRTTGGIPPIPAVKLKNPLSVYHAISAIALLTQIGSKYR